MGAQAALLVVPAARLVANAIAAFPPARLRALVLP
jgi:hypothetical protein